MLSWSAPWAPDGVQLNYTVNVTNTNTSVVTVFTTSDTNITLTRSTFERGECNRYMWSVTAVNPAGISGLANYTTTVLFAQGKQLFLMPINIIIYNYILQHRL